MESVLDDRRLRMSDLSNIKYIRYKVDPYIANIESPLRKYKKKKSIDNRYDFLKFDFKSPFSSKWCTFKVWVSQSDWLFCQLAQIEPSWLCIRLTWDYRLLRPSRIHVVDQWRPPQHRPIGLFDLPWSLNSIETCPYSWFLDAFRKSFLHR